MDAEQILKLLELARQSFICLRCGECCFAWSLRLPDGKEKPERQNCPYLIPKRKIGNRWQEASCTIHDKAERPLVCQQAVMGLSFCPLGAGIWKNLKDENPEDEIPETAKEAIKIFYRKEVQR